ncbi:MAG: glycosyltransferase [Polyangiaceae bacterium]
MTSELVFALWTIAPPSCAAFAALKRRSPALAITHARQSMLVLRPVHGAPSHLEEAALSSRAAGTHARIRFLASENDAVAQAALAPIVKALTEEGFDAAITVTGAKAGNPKVVQLAHAEGIHFSSDTSRVLIVDADVVLTGSLVQALDAAMTTGSHIAWAAPVERTSKTPADYASRAVLCTSLHAFPLLARLDEGGMVGKCFLTTAATVRMLGGFSSLAMVLGEDMELAERARRAGLRVSCVTFPATSALSGRTLREVFQRYVRWLLVIRHQRPHLLLSYPALFFAYPLQLLVACFVPHGILLAVIATVARMLVATLATAASGEPLRPRDIVFLPAGDVLLLAAFAGAVFGVETRWGKERLRFDARGYLRTEGST